MIAKVEHLYIHIPFCKSICTYCDFVRFVANNSCIDLYIRKIIDEISYKYKTHQFKTIYIGGGTPNYLNKKNLTLLLSTLKKYLKNKYEFTIECNPEFLTKEQAIILKQNKVNRVSIGAQTTNNNILQKFQRRHTIKNIQEAIQNLRGVDIFNISIDFIYGFNELKDCDIFSATKFIGD
jgi:oxygen-independent coproporphyrinogen-3 oxidase